MNILLEGPFLTGQWSELSHMELSSLGHDVHLIYHNKKSLRGRVNKRLSKLGLFADDSRFFPKWEHIFRQRLLGEFDKSDFQLLFSIQGKIDPVVIEQFRKKNPKAKVVFWWGDILTSGGEQKIKLLHEHVDLVAVSYLGVFEQLKADGVKNLFYLPFGYSPLLHNVDDISQTDREKYTAQVSFVGTYYPERGELIRFLNQNLDEPVSVWGRGWRKCPGVKSRGSLSLQESLKVHNCSEISLNIHHRDTNNGFNMKFYEIPFAGGFEITDWKPLLDGSDMGACTVSFKDKDELLKHLKFYLTHHDAREVARQKMRDYVEERCRYATYFSEMIEAVDL